MNAIPFLLAAALTPRDQWHDRWRYINRLAGIVAERAGWEPGLHLPDQAARVQAVVDRTRRDFGRFLDAQEAAGVDIAAIRAQERELLDGLTMRVAECLMLGNLTTLTGVKMTIDVIRRTKAKS